MIEALFHGVIAIALWEIYRHFRGRRATIVIAELVSEEATLNVQGVIQVFKKGDLIRTEIVVSE